MTFLWANRLGFNDLDWDTIIKLYQHTFDQKIDGVISINDTAIWYILPEYDTLKTRRQFQNTYADYIAGSWIIVKKKATIDDMNRILSPWNIPHLVFQTLDHLDTIIDQRLIQLYIPQTSSGLQSILTSYWLTTRYQPDTLYLRDMSFGMNKIDRFVNKHTKLYSWELLLAETTGDILPIELSTILPWHILTLTIDYDLNIPIVYRKALIALEQEFGVISQATQRIVLGQDPQRFTQGIIHLPPSRSISHITWDHYRSLQTKSPFSSIWAYRIASKNLYKDHKTIKYKIQVYSVD